MAFVDFKAKAIEIVKEAVAEDNAGNYESALRLYKSSLEYFSTHLKYEKNPSAKKAITAKASRHAGAEGWDMA
jgi:vacuolar protein-sorting-associated protein 4